MIPLGPVLVLLAQAPATPLPAEGEPIRYQAEQGTSDGHGEVLHLLGKAELRTDTARIQADRIDYDQRTQIVTASGHCYAVSGLSGAVADGLTLDLDANWLKLENGRFFLKADVPPEVLLQTTTPEQLLATGRTTLAARAERVERVDKGHLKIHGPRLHPLRLQPARPALEHQGHRRGRVPGGPGVALPPGHLRVRRARSSRCRSWTCRSSRRRRASW